jgi:transcriptional regulator NrdR family protein
MNCVGCHGENTNVISSRTLQGTRYRRRTCKECGARFFTQENIIDKMPIIGFWRKARKKAKPKKKPKKKLKPKKKKEPKIKMITDVKIRTNNKSPEWLKRIERKLQA